MGGGSTGLRTSKQALRQAQGDRAEVSTFLWDGQRLLAETTAGSTAAQYTAGPGSYGPMLSQRRGATSSFYHPSVQGTVETLTDASGNVTDSYAFTAFGVPVAATGATTNPHRYIGALGYYTDPTGLDYVRARYLRPTTGSWLSVDPIASEPRYQYVGGRATRAADASGAGLGRSRCEAAYPDPDSPHRWLCELCELLVSIPFLPSDLLSIGAYIGDKYCDRLSPPLRFLCKLVLNGPAGMLQDWAVGLLCVEQAKPIRLVERDVQRECIASTRREADCQACCRREASNPLSVDRCVEACERHYEQAEYGL